MMNLKCPVCKADNTTPPNCRRCKADLALLWQLEAQRASHLYAAKAALEQGEFDDALDELDQALALRHDPNVERFRGCIFLLAEDFESATSRAYAPATHGASHGVHT